MRYSGGNGILLVAVCFLFSSCELLDSLRPVARKQKAQVQQTQVNSSAEPGGLMTTGEKMNFHRWMVKEMIEQILARPIKDKNEVEGWANVLSQRGSVEGVYHGLVLSTEFVDRENGRGDVKALRFFALEMAMLDSPASSEQDPKIKAASERYAKDHMSTSVFTMKRELGERIIRDSEARKDNKETLAAWYAAIAARWARQRVNFGMEQRNRVDEIFHFNWAKENNLGMIQWELLNKAHRLINSYGGIVIAPASPATAAAPPSPISPVGK